MYLNAIIITRRASSARSLVERYAVDSSQQDLLQESQRERPHQRRAVALKRFKFNGLFVVGHRARTGGQSISRSLQHHYFPPRSTFRYTVRRRRWWTKDRAPFAHLNNPRCRATLLPRRRRRRRRRVRVSFHTNIRSGSHMPHILANNNRYKWPF